ncbi:hypothetical protein CUR178_01085 [Leishmania enriettii]|uniref:Uncharacterized protein n=1 Tax=Leishmania enriettii TaxID=5663 RepID=A0A836FQW7_LEIEN|nr:hypothetical protein CUR178_01085 [Leishmania enriettii]
MPKTRTQGDDVRRVAVCTVGARVSAHRFCEVFDLRDVTMNALEREPLDLQHLCRRRRHE